MGKIGKPGGNPHQYQRLVGARLADRPEAGVEHVAIVGTADDQAQHSIVIVILPIGQGALLHSLEGGG